MFGEMFPDIRRDDALLPTRKASPDLRLDSGFGETEACNFVGQENAERLEIGLIVGCRVLDQRGELGCRIPERGILKKDPRDKVLSLNTGMVVQVANIKEDI
jgi:hypothetical protein